MFFKNSNLKKMIKIWSPHLNNIIFFIANKSWSPYFEFILKYTNDSKLATRKCHLFLWLMSINSDSISNDDDMACHMLIRCYD